MNIYDVSRRAGVSIATVSRVLNNNSNVSEQTRQKVLKVMADIGYTPNAFARGLGLNTMKTIGIICCDSSDTYLANAIYFLERELRASGYDALLCCTGYQLEDKQNYFRFLLSKRVDAIIIAGSMFLDLEPENNQYLIDGAKEVPIMLVNGYLEGENIHCTVCDDYTAVYESVVRLIRSGRKAPLYLYATTSYSGSNKRRGYINACEDYGVIPRDHMVTGTESTIVNARDYLLSIPEDDWIFDAIATSEDALAVGAVKFAHKRGLSIPKDLAVIGYNNSLLSLGCEPELTSIDTKVEALCESTVKTLMGVLEGKEMPVKTTIPAAFIERSTTNFIQED